jgi:3-oxoacyl-[acyl-carrier protein] reductase
MTDTTDTKTKTLAGRNALVTGAGRGIGRAIAIELAARGAAVCVNYRRDDESAAATVAAIRSNGGTAVPIRASVSETEEIDRLAAEAVEELGSIDLLVCNAGIASRGLPVAETEPEELLRVVSTHALGAHRLLNRLLPTMRAAGRANVVVISSVATERMDAGGAPYAMGKNALEALALTVAKEEAANGIRVNIVAPGLVATEMGSRLAKAVAGVDDIAELDAAQPFGRVCRPEDIARAVAFLSGPETEMVTGQRLAVDGLVRL